MDGMHLLPRGAGVAATGGRHVEMPTLFLMTLVICFPSLYVFSALLGRVVFRADVACVVGDCGCQVTVLASFGQLWILCVE